MNIPFRKHLMDGSRQYRDMSPEEFYDLAGDGRTTETVKDNADAIADHTADMVAHMTQSQKNQLAAAVPNTRTINGHALSGNVIITKSDVGLGNVDNTAAPTKLPNPYALTFTGGATGSYDGSAAKSIAIPAIEYGTWTPTIYGTTSGNFSISLNGRQPVYCKIGKLVCIEADMIVGSGDAAGSLQIGGLPYYSQWEVSCMLDLMANANILPESYGTVENSYIKLMKGKVDELLGSDTGGILSITSLIAVYMTT